MDNGDNRPKSASRSFFLSFCTPATIDTAACSASSNPINGNFAYLAFDDSGDGPNDNHDDWVGTVSVRQVPEPASLMTLALGALGVAARARRRRA